jgi:hypothetical protein
MESTKPLATTFAEDYADEALLLAERFVFHTRKPGPLTLDEARHESERMRAVRQVVPKTTD